MNENQPGIDRREAIRRGAIAVGAVLSFSTIEALAQGDRGKAGARVLKGESYSTLEAFVAVLLPRTDTPSGADVGVSEFVDFFVGRFATEGEAKTIRNGLAKLNEASRNGHGKSFSELGENAQLALLKQWATSSDKTQTAFLTKIREFSLLGYFTSEEVGTKVLKYLPIPGDYEGCVDLEKTTGGLAWSV